MRGAMCGVNLLLAMFLLMVVLCFAVLFVETAHAQLENMPRLQVEHRLPYIAAPSTAMGEGPVIPQATVRP